MATRRTPPSEESGTPTIRQVAARAGVSMATVSRVMAGNYPVAEKTRARVMKAITDLDYVGNPHARSLAGSATETVAVLVYDITGPSFAAVARGVEQEAATRGRLCMICTTHGDPEQELRLVDLMRRQRAAAVIVAGGTYDLDVYGGRMSRLARSLDSAGSRLVLCGRPPLPEDAPVTTVNYDNENGAFAAVGTLLSMGHRRILALPGVAGHTTAEARLAGYRRALAAYGVAEDPGLIIHTDYTRSSGERAARQALSAKLDFTAVFAGTDMVAAGFIDAARAAGVRFPEDVSIVGYDDIPLAANLFPKLTTVHVPYEQLGREAVRLAIERRDREVEDHVTLGTHIVVRESVAPRPIA